MGQAKQRGTFEERRAQALKNRSILSPRSFTPIKGRWLSALVSAISISALQRRK